MPYGRTVFGWLRALELFPYLMGAEGEGEGGEGAAGGKGEGAGAGEGVGSAGGSGSSGGAGSGEGEGEGTPSPDKEPDTFDRAYVEKLRAEAAENRVKAKKLEDEINERKKAEMDDLTRAQTERDEEKAKRVEIEDELGKLRLQIAVSQAATTANFHDPHDALALIPSGEIRLDEDGVPNRQSVEAAVKRLADAKPHLVRVKGVGSGDGGARGSGPATVQEKQAEYERQFQQAGGVPKPR